MFRAYYSFIPAEKAKMSRKIVTKMSQNWRNYFSFIEKLPPRFTSYPMNEK